MLLIEDMSMPKSCAYCDLKIYQYSECCLTHKKIATWRMADRPMNCPLKEVRKTEAGTYEEI